MAGQLPKDEAGHPIQAVGFIDGEHQVVSISGTTARTASNFTGTSGELSRARIICLWADVATHIAFGSSTVDAETTDMPIPANTVMFLSIGPDVDRVAGIKVSGADDGNLYVQECL